MAGPMLAVRLRVRIRGAVQGVGFRPFVHRLATELGLAGWVTNSARGVTIEVEGSRAAAEEMLCRLPRERPARAFVASLEHAWLDPAGYRGFAIRPSDDDGDRTAFILPDVATCADCLAELRHRGDRRHGYPFTNCTNCGPRFTIIEALPYDRPNTTMRRFPMCATCRAEYEDPRDRRFHAQPNACPRCGPQLALWDGDGAAIAAGDTALSETVAALRGGGVVAVKGLGGFHLMVAAADGAAVRRLRQRKNREDKPFAVMYPDLDRVRADCRVSALEEQLLEAPEAPIVLLERRPGGTREVAAEVAPGNPTLGVMLPYTPLHHLLAERFGRVLVATSGNLSDEVIATAEDEARVRLKGLADRFLVHDRPIARHADDSVVRVVGGRVLVLRRARGYAPLPVTLPGPVPPLLAVGGQLKSTVAISVGRDVFLSQHIGDLETLETDRAFRRVVASFREIYAHRPEAVACDLHPDYRSTRFAASLGKPLVPVQHHHAHVLACMAENELSGRVLGVAWDGTGHGRDGGIWGGEFLAVEGGDFTRIAHLRGIPLPGGEVAIREPRRAALGVLYSLLGPAVLERRDLAPIAAFTPAELAVLGPMLERRLNTPLATSAGRLFDAVAAVAGARQRTSFEGQAAMQLEFELGPGAEAAEPYPLPVAAGAPLVVDWGPLARALLDDVARALPLSSITARFHNALVQAIVAVAEGAAIERVVLTGGCFQNRYLTERAVGRLAEAGFRPYWHQRVPPNDAGLALGQLVAAAHLRAAEPGR